jgi:hypothetical protein
MGRLRLKNAGFGVDITTVSLRRHPNLVVAMVFAVATLASLGPHLLMLGYSVTGTRPPAALLFVCPLHRLDAGHTQSFTLKAKPLT